MGIPLRFILHVVEREEVIRLIRENYEEIKKFGVKRIGIFGSVVRGEAREDSDVDVVVEFEEGRGNMRDFIGLADFLEELFKKEVDLLTLYGVETIRIKSVRETIKRELEYVQEG